MAEASLATRRPRDYVSLCAQHKDVFLSAVQRCVEKSGNLLRKTAEALVSNAIDYGQLSTLRASYRGTRLEYVEREDDFLRVGWITSSGFDEVFTGLTIDTRPIGSTKITCIRSNRNKRSLSPRAVHEPCQFVEFKLTDDDMLSVTEAFIESTHIAPDQ